MLYGVGIPGPRVSGDLSRLKDRWRDMLARCYNCNNSSYKWYGAKGVTVCKRWHSFQNFADDILDMPNGVEYMRSEDGSWHLDKDTKCNSNQPPVYSKDSCVILRSNINASEGSTRNKPNWTPVIVNGVYYPSVSAAERIIGTGESTIMSFLRKGKKMKEPIMARYALPDEVTQQMNLHGHSSEDKALSPRHGRYFVNGVIVRGEQAVADMLGIGFHAARNIISRKSRKYGQVRRATIDEVYSHKNTNKHTKTQSDKEN